jgi:hypothetical protein
MLPVNLVHVVMKHTRSMVQKFMAILINSKEQEAYFPILLLKAGVCSLLYLERKRSGL